MMRTLFKWLFPNAYSPLRKCEQCRQMFNKGYGIHTHVGWFCCAAHYDEFQNDLQW
jgi:hypothetical protein